MAKRMTIAEKKQMEDMILSGQTDREIAEILGRNIKTIITHRKNMGYDKTGHGVLKDNTQKENLGVDINKESNTSEDKIRQWQEYFIGTERFKKLSAKMPPNMMEDFAYQWAVYHSQLDDMTIAEEDTLELMIVLKLRIEENQKNFAEAQQYEESLKAQMSSRGELDPEDSDDLLLYQMIQSNNKIKLEINKELKDLTSKYTEIQQSLNVTREQRSKNQNIGADTFLTLVRSLNERDERIEAGKYNERMKLATEHQRTQMKKNHEFANGEIEPILLDGADFKGTKIDE